MIVTDPDNLTITPENSIQTDEEYLIEIPGELYYSENELGPDGQPKDVVYWPNPKKGDFNIRVIPDPDAAPDATYSLEFTSGDNTIVLAQNIPIGQIPNIGYGITVGDNQTINSFIPVQIDIKPDSYPNVINLGSKGVVPVAIYSSATFDARQIDIDSINVEGTSIKPKGNSQPIFSYLDLNSDSFVDLLIKISTEALELNANDTRVDLEGNLKDGTIIKGSDSINIVPQNHE